MGIRVSNGYQYQASWYVFFGGLLITAALTPLVMRLARRIGAVDRGGYRRVYQGVMPLLGGLGIAIPIVGLCAGSYAVGALIVSQWKWLATHASHESFNSLFAFAQMRQEFALLAVGSAVILALGVVDDIRGLRARYKLAGQIAVALLFCFFGYTVKAVEIPWLGPVTFGPLWGAMVTVLWIVGLINAFNLIDGVDGLAAGTAFIIASGLAVLATVTGAAAVGGSALMVLVCAALAGSCLAFLVYNFNPARVFLGDTGSMFLGYALGTLTLLGAHKTETAAIVMAPVFALGFPIFETCVSMLRRFVHGKPIFAADQHHTHHRLLKKGYTQRQTVILLYGATLLCMIAAVLSQLLATHWIPIAIYGVTALGVAWLAGYLRPMTLASLSKDRQRSSVLLALARYAVLGMNSQLSRARPDDVLALGRRELGLRFLEVWLEEGPALLLTSGSINKERQARFPFRLVEKMKVNSADGKALVILYQFDYDPEPREQQDVSACLAHVFQDIAVSELKATAPLPKGVSEAKILAMD